MSVSVERKEKKDDSSNNELSVTEKSKMVDKVVELLVAKEKKGWSKRGEKKEEFQKLADKFGISERTIHNNYYKRVLPQVKEDQEKEEEKAQRKAKLTVVKNDDNKDKKEEEKQTEQMSTEEINENKEVAKEEIKEETPKEIIEDNEPSKEAKVEATIGATETSKRTSSVDDSINEFLNKTGEEVKKTSAKFEKDVYGRPLKPPYKHNDIIEVRVDHIRDFGVFCYTCDEYEYKGLIHISEIKDIFVDDANDYFTVGDIIKVKVVMATPSRLTFSTREMKLQPKSEKEDVEVNEVTLPKNPPINTIGEKFGKELQNKFSSVAVEPQASKQKEQFEQSNHHPIQKEVEEILKEDEATFENNEIEELITSQLEEESKQQIQEPVVSNKINERDFVDVQSFLNNKIGALSPNAKHKLMEILEKKGMFKSTIAISKVAENFVVDYGLIFMKMLEKELEKDECL